MAAGNPVFTRPSKFGSLDMIQEIVNQAFTTGQVVNYDMDVSGASWMRIHAELLGTVTAGDLSMFVAPFRADGTTIANGQLQPTLIINPVAWGSNLYSHRLIDVRGLPKVRVIMQNLNAGTLTGIVTVTLTSR